MTLLYAINLLCALVLLFVPVWFSVRVLKLAVFNPFSITLAINMPVQLMKLFVGPSFLIDNGLFDEGYQFAILMGNVLIVAQTVSLLIFYRFFSLLHIERYLPFQNALLDSRDLYRAARFFVVGFIVAIYLLASAEFGVFNWLANPRIGYQLYRVGQGHWYALAISMLAVAMVLSGFADPRPKKIIQSGVFYLGLGYFLGSKGSLLMIFTMTIILLWFVRWKYLKKLILFTLPLIFALLIWNLYLALEDFELESVVNYFDYYKNAADFYREYLDGSLNLFNGEVFLTSFWAYVPRLIWPDKPFVYGILHVNEIFFPGQAELTNTPAFGGAVEQFADFGVSGVVLSGLTGAQSLLTALLSYLIFRRPGINVRSMSLATIMLIIIQFSPGFGTFLPGGLYILLLFFVGIIILAMRRQPAYRNMHTIPNAKSIL